MRQDSQAVHICQPSQAEATAPPLQEAHGRKEKQTIILMNRSIITLGNECGDDNYQIDGGSKHHIKTILVVR
jgi:hypothetical protein